MITSCQKRRCLGVVSPGAANRYKSSPIVREAVNIISPKRKRTLDKQLPDSRNAFGASSIQALLNATLDRVDFSNNLPQHSYQAKRFNVALAEKLWYRFAGKLICVEERKEMAILIEQIENCDLDDDMKLVENGKAKDYRIMVIKNYIIEFEFI